MSIKLAFSLLLILCFLQLSSNVTSQDLETLKQATTGDCGGGTAAKSPDVAGDNKIPQIPCRCFIPGISVACGCTDNVLTNMGNAECQRQIKIYGGNLTIPDCQ